MKFRVERDALADAVAWTAKSLPSRPSVPVLAGVMLRVGDGGLQVSGFDYEVSSQVSVDVQSDADGAALVSGRLLAEITKALPAKPVDIAAVGAHLELVCGSARFTLPTMPVEDYPTLPEMPESAGTVDAGAFAAAVGQVAVAAGRDETLPMMTGVRIELNGSTMSMLATDRYRLALRELEWRPDDPQVSVNALVPARTLHDTAKTLGPLGGEVTVALAQGAAGEGMIGFAGGTRRTTSRLLDGAKLLAVTAMSNVLGTINGFTALAVGTAAQMDWIPRWHESSSGADHPTLGSAIFDAEPAPPMMVRDGAADGTEGHGSVDPGPAQGDSDLIHGCTSLRANFRKAVPSAGKPHL